MAPEMMLSSMSDPSEASEDAFEALAGGAQEAHETTQKEIKEVADAAIKEFGKDVNMAFKVAPAAIDVKVDILACCKAEKAELLVLGPGTSGQGNVPSYAIANAKGFTVCVVRDKVE